MRHRQLTNTAPRQLASSKLLHRRALSQSATSYKRCLTHYIRATDRVYDSMPWRRRRRRGPAGTPCGARAAARPAQTARSPAARQVSGANKLRMKGVIMQSIQHARRSLCRPYPWLGAAMLARNCRSHMSPVPRQQPQSLALCWHTVSWCSPPRSVPSCPPQGVLAPV